MVDSEFRDRPDTRSNDRPAAGGQFLEELACTLDLVDAFSGHRFVYFEGIDFRFGTQMGRDHVHGLESAASMCGGDHRLRIERMTRCPLAPGSFDALRRIDENAIEIEQNGPAPKPHRVRTWPVCAPGRRLTSRAASRDRRVMGRPAGIASFP